MPAVASARDQAADIDVALGDDAVEGCHDLLIDLLLVVIAQLRLQCRGIEVSRLRRVLLGL